MNDNPQKLCALIDTVDGLGNPLRLRVTAGQRHDIIKAHDLIVDLDFDYLIADRSYGTGFCG